MIAATERVSFNRSSTKDRRALSVASGNLCAHISPKVHLVKPLAVHLRCIDGYRSSHGSGMMRNNSSFEESSKDKDDCNLSFELSSSNKHLFGTSTKSLLFTVIRLDQDGQTEKYVCPYNEATEPSAASNVYISSPQEVGSAPSET